MRKLRVLGALVVLAVLWLGGTPAPAGEEPEVSVEDTIYAWEGQPKEPGAARLNQASYTPLRIPIKLSTPWTTDITVYHIARDGTAVERQDYIGGDGRTRIPKGSTVGNAEMLIVNDDKCERDEYFEFVLTRTTVGKIGNAVAKVIIRDDDCG